MSPDTAVAPGGIRFRPESGSGEDSGGISEWRRFRVEDVESARERPFNARQTVQFHTAAAGARFYQTGEDAPRGRDPLMTLGRLRQLARGWDGYDAPPPNATALGNLLLALGRVFDLAQSEGHLAPSVEGGVTLSFASDGRLGVVEFYNDGEILALQSQADSTPLVWPVSSDAVSIEESIRRVAEFCHLPA